MWIQEPVIQIDDPEIDAAAIEERIRRGVTRHALDTSTYFPPFQIQPPNDRLPEDIRFALEQVRATYDQVGIERVLVGSRLPWLERVKQMLHQLVVFHVNRAADRQLAFNHAATHALDVLVTHLSAQAGEILSLRREIESLRKQIEQMESDAGGDSHL